jgi:hypothetical protein
MTMDELNLIGKAWNTIIESSTPKLCLAFDTILKQRARGGGFGSLVTPPQPPPPAPPPPLIPSVSSASSTASPGPGGGGGGEILLAKVEEIRGFFQSKIDTIAKDREAEITAPLRDQIKDLTAEVDSIRTENQVLKEMIKNGEAREKEQEAELERSKARITELEAGASKDQETIKDMEAKLEKYRKRMKVILEEKSCGNQAGKKVG